MSCNDCCNRCLKNTRNVAALLIKSPQASRVILTLLECNELVSNHINTESELQMPNLSGMLSNLRQQRTRLQDEIEQLDDAISAIGKLVGRNGVGRPRGRRGPKRGVTRHISAAGRRRIAAAQRARWAKIKQQRAGK